MIKKLVSFLKIWSQSAEAYQKLCTTHESELNVQQRH